MRGLNLRNNSVFERNVSWIILGVLVFMAGVVVRLAVEALGAPRSEERRTISAVSRITSKQEPLAQPGNVDQRGATLKTELVSNGSAIEIRNASRSALLDGVPNARRESVRDVRDLFERYAKENPEAAGLLRRNYLKIFGAAAVAPLAVKIPEYEAWRRVAGETLFEERENLLRRISIVNNNTPNVLEDAEFQVIAYEFCEGLHVSPGRRLGDTLTDEWHIAQVMTGKNGVKLERLPGGIQEVILALARDWRLRKEILRREVWSKLESLLSAKIASQHFENFVNSVFVTGVGNKSKIVVTKWGEDTELDRLVSDLEECRSKSYERVVSLLKAGY
jgi:hypothetical protein